MHYTKPALTYEDQLDLLISRGLVCSDHPRALECLKRIGYYRLSAYFIPFRHGSADDFRDGTTLDDVLDLYKFDGGLRLMTMQAMDGIEVAVRAAVTYHLAHDLGPFGYADPANFDQTFAHVKFLNIVARESNRSSETFVAHYKSKYTSETNLPVWMATELISFGALSLMYQHLRTGLRKKIARDFDQPEPVFVSWLHALTATRNICAHHGRLWNKELAVKPVLPNVWKAQGVSNRRFYVIALIIQTMLSAVSPDSKWKERLVEHFNAYPAVDLSQMQFSTHWQSQTPWT